MIKFNTSRSNFMSKRSFTLKHLLGQKLTHYKTLLNSKEIKKSQTSTTGKYSHHCNQPIAASLTFKLIKKAQWKGLQYQVMKRTKIQTKTWSKPQFNSFLSVNKIILKSFQRNYSPTLTIPSNLTIRGSKRSSYVTMTCTTKWRLYPTRLSTKLSSHSHSLSR
jgi:hypothetical protein